MRLEFFAPGVPVGQPRGRPVAFRGKARIYDPGTANNWKQTVAAAAEPLLPKRPAALGLRGPLSLLLVFTMPRPKSHFRKNGTLKPGAPKWHETKPDADNLAKAVMDVLSVLGVWYDDDQIADLYVKKIYASSLSAAGVFVGVNLLEEHAS